MKKYCESCSNALAKKAKETQTRILLIISENDPILGFGICCQCDHEGLVCYVADDENDNVLDASECRNIIKHRVAFGIWVDLANGLHINVPDICDHLDLAQTKENHDLIAKMAEDLIRRECGENITVEHRQTLMD